MQYHTIGTLNNHVKAIYKSQRYYGCDVIIRSYLGLPDEQVLPLTIPHGIDFYRDAMVGDIHSFEPLYLAFRDDLALSASKYKAAIRFPHPWLFIIGNTSPERGHGTLFIAPPPSENNFELMYTRIQEGGYPKPWGMLLKDRGLVKTDFEWWTERGFAVHTAGNMMNPSFFYQLRDIIKIYEHVASPNMSSAVIFAVAMSRKALAIPDVPIKCVEIADLEKYQDFIDKDKKVRDTWLALLATNPEVARVQAEELLGKQYMAAPEILRSRLLNAISALDSSLHLYPLKSGLINKLMVGLICRGLPAQKFFPHPLKKIAHKLLALVKLNRLTVFYGSDFSHYEVAGASGRYELRKLFAFQLGKSATPGFAFRK